MKHHGFYPIPRQNGNHHNLELNLETKLVQTHNIERRIQELEQRNERQQLKKISQVHHDVSRVNSAVERVNQMVDSLSKKNDQRTRSIKKNPWDDEITPFSYSKDD
ncbi:hypothetical protein ACQKL5_09935 [Peribacillus sp. NPDC097675]|uniref:hypothetical protein n=1 Tax=Peribacillus sp. NPDC097675 TaxID=3390618 RepID=UPI003D0896BE